MKINKQRICNRINAETFEETVLHKALSRLPALSENGPWLAGGAIRKTIQCAALDSDFDFFFKDQEQLDNFAEGLQEKGARLLVSNDKNEKWILPTEIPEDTEGENIYLPEMEIQLIKFQFYESAEAVIDSFDFTLCQFAYDGENLFMSDFALWDVARKKIVPHKITYGTSSLRRLMKYANQGFTACGGCLSEILEQVVRDPSVIQSETLYID
jgi:hypothetical protein